ncbi:MAG: tryptophan synthase subunit alpha [Phycisphaerales bacterium]|nr:tryptophan synthase subunit alpha [Phycisphaerae bacterium]NNF41684.1 tryptophan synthase subunit alpha [Phycisphaerales bacterium]NNM26912.1 tryptophan synthase subunit alpha [Phycisphaerales bacterium]
MSRIDDIFAARRRAGLPTLMPYITAGHPTLEVTRAVIPALETAGASIVEVGFPFSDPIADGAVIAGAMHEALAAGVTPRDVLAAVRAVRPATTLGLVAMVSDSIIERVGPARFVAEAADAGFDGLIVPDLDVDAAGTLRDLAANRDLAFALLVAPTTPADRIGHIAALCRGFVYLLARAGLTGERTEAPEVADRVAMLRAVTDLPIAVGFGITRPDHVRVVTRSADAAIVGSALVRTMSGPDPVGAARALVSELARGLEPLPDDNFSTRT